MVPTLMVESSTPVSFLQGLGGLMGLRLSNCVPESSAAPATPVASRPTLAAARTESPAIARTHRRAFMDSPHVVANRRPSVSGCCGILARHCHELHAPGTSDRAGCPTASEGPHRSQGNEVDPDVRRVPEKVHNGGSPSATLVFAGSPARSPCKPGTRTHPPSFYRRRSP